MKRIFALICSAALSQAALAESAPTETSDNKITIDTSKLYIGAGLNHNRIDQSSFGGSDLKASGFQIFAGYDLGNKKGFDLAVETGLIQSKDLRPGQDVDGIWGAAVIKKDLPEINDKLSALVRLGYGINGDDGLIMGFGGQYRLHPKAFLRLEYLNKDLTQSYQVNATYRF